MSEKISSYEEFWPYYLNEHSAPLCRGLHFFGTTLALFVLVLAIGTNTPVLLLASLVCGYGPAWIGHFFIEKNRPATFKYPFWSLISDFRMYFLWLFGKLDSELKLHTVRE